jgi:2-desacetyl-2-hydroxyethyl bacteriochlorophyllide A dehydrogenase
MTIQSDDITALWYEAPGHASIRPVLLPQAGAGDVVVRALWSGISRGTERMIFNGLVPESEYQRMRCPHQDGAFPFPVKYGYALVGRIIEGSHMGETVFLLHPHQSLAVVPEGEVHILPAGLPPHRAVLAANMETALNAVWDSGVSAGDRVLVVGGGIVGLMIAHICAGMPGTTVTVTDIEPDRAAVTQALGAAFLGPAEAPGEQDVVFHASTSAEGLRLALASAGAEARVVEVSWYGTKTVEVNLGGAFHARRLQLVSSQVGQVPAARRARWDTSRRMAAALRLLLDPRLDALITREVAFDTLPDRLPEVLSAQSPGLATVVRY